MPHAVRTRPLRSFAGVRTTASRFALALCAAVLAAVGLGGAAAPVLGAAATGPWAAASGSVGSGTTGGGSAGGGSAGGGYGATPTPATVRAVGHSTLNGTAGRVRAPGQHENSKPAFANVHRGQPDVVPVAVLVARFGLAEPIVPAGPALTGAPPRAPPASPGLPDTRAPPASGRS